MFVCCECCVLSGRGTCDELITRPEESYLLWCVVVCDLETSWMRRPWPRFFFIIYELYFLHLYTHVVIHIMTHYSTDTLPKCTCFGRLIPAQEGLLMLTVVLCHLPPNNPDTWTLDVLPLRYQL
jgi:hypothetical protein